MQQFFFTTNACSKKILRGIQHRVRGLRIYSLELLQSFISLVYVLQKIDPRSLRIANMTWWLAEVLDLQNIRKTKDIVMYIRIKSLHGNNDYVFHLLKKRHFQILHTEDKNSRSESHFSFNFKFNSISRCTHM